MPRSEHTVEQTVDVGAVVRAIHQDEVDRQQHRRHVVAFDRAEMHPGDADAVPRDTDVAGKALVPCREQRLERAARTGGDLPLVGFDEVVELDQVDMVDAHPLERPLEFGPRPVSLRSPVLVARNTSPRCSASHGFSRSSEAP